MVGLLLKGTAPCPSSNSSHSMNQFQMPLLLLFGRQDKLPGTTAFDDEMRQNVVEIDGRLLAFRCKKFSVKIAKARCVGTTRQRIKHINRAGCHFFVMGDTVRCFRCSVIEFVRP